MTDEIMSAIENAKTLVEVEDIYRPSSRSVKQGLRWQEKRGLNHWLNLS